MTGCKPYRIEFQPVGRRGDCEEGESLLECGRKAGVDLANLCGGRGKCHACKVRIVKGHVPEPTPAERAIFSSEDLTEGWRLACQVYPSGDCSLYVPPESMSAPQRTQVEGLGIQVEPDPPVGCYEVLLPSPGLSDPTADADRLIQGLQQHHGVRCRRVDREVLRTLSEDIRALGWRCRAFVRGEEVIGLAPGQSRSLGLAVDLGTTKIAGYLVELDTGKRLASKGIMNPQIRFGEDIITRIDQALKSPERAGQIRHSAVQALNSLARDLCEESQAHAGQILEAEIVCNTAMHHLLLGLPLKQLVMAPYVPAASLALEWKARDVGLDIAPGAYLHTLPNVAGFVGGDHVAMLLAADALDRRGVVLALDIGTNTEVSLIQEGRISSVSCASGPAFEGYHITHGMRAAKGAIERLRINGDSVEYQTIDSAPAAGICGSGALDALAQMYLAGAVDRGGRMNEKHPRVREIEGERAFVIVPGKGRDARGGVGITQRDIRRLQLAKAAIRTGIQVLLEESGLSSEGLDGVVIAGAFGSYIDVESAMTVGMLPRLPRARFRQIGNAAGMGAQMALVSSAVRRQAEVLASSIRYVELAGRPRFSEIFAQACFLGDYEERENWFIRQMPG